MPAGEELDQPIRNRCYRDRARRVNGETITGHFLREHLVGKTLQIDHSAIEWSERVDLSHHSPPVQPHCRYHEP